MRRLGLAIIVLLGLALRSAPALAQTSLFDPTDAASAYSGTVGCANGGTGLTGTPTNGQLPIGNGACFTLAPITGTANEITVTNGSGSITLDLPATINVNAQTATALAANGANCSAGQAAAGVDASGAAEGCTTYLPLSTQSVTCADSGGVGAGTLTITPSAATQTIDITNNDADGCTVTLGETGAAAGWHVFLVVIANAGGNVAFSDTAGVSELAGAYNAGITDTLSLVYVNSAWHELARSNN